MYDPYRYAPSKMIDYLITERPILNVEYELDQEVLQQFLNGDYTNTFNQFKKEKFDISKIAKQFTDLIKSPESDV